MKTLSRFHLAFLLLAYAAGSLQFGMLDTCGFFKDNAYLLQSWWTAKPIVHLLPHWNWPGQEGRPINVRVYSNTYSIELLLNGKSLGRKPMPRNSHLEWTVDYQPGTLLARGFAADGKEVASDVVATTGPAAAVQLIPNQEKITADGESISVITVRVNDASGRMVPVADNLVSFSLAGPGKIIGVGNGDPASHEPDKYIETVQSVPVLDWRTLAIDARNAGPESDPGFDDSSWEKARDPRRDEHRVDPPASIFRGQFILPAAQGTRPSPWCCAAWGRRSPSMSTATYSESTWPAIRLVTPTSWTKNVLVQGRNVVTIFSTRFQNGVDQLFHWDGPGPAAVQVVTPSPQWKRSVFNGLAQVIVQSTQQAGEIKLTATSPDLQPANLKIVTQ